MRPHHGHRVIGTLLVLLAAACTKAENKQVRASPDSSRSAAGASAVRDTSGMKGMEGMSGQSRTMDGSTAGMPGEMLTHMVAMTGATADAARAMLPKHRQLVANMIARTNGEMRDMQMASDAEWSTTVDSLRTDLVRLTELSGAELTAMMPALLARANRLSTMHGKMMGAMMNQAQAVRASVGVQRCTHRTCGIGCGSARGRHLACPSMRLSPGRIMATIELGRYLRKNSERYHECIEACVACLVACEMCSDACLDEKDAGMMKACIRLDRDCADACAAAVRAMSRGGPLADALCRSCAEACDACATECEKHAGMADHCKLCAEACRACAKACRQMVA